MIAKELIEEVKKKLIITFKPRKIYIFGSYAWGTPNEDSDLDLLIVVDSCKPEDRHALLAEGHRVLFGLDLSKDLLLYTEDEFHTFSEDPACFCYKVKHDGKKIYEAQA